ncbi:MAG: hypothetical protein ACKVHQ_01120 [Gammaproteobacteria bacterium]|jgi:uncharacterized membrane protein SpoIIM required for sporulation
MIELIQSNPVFSKWILVISLLMFVVTIILIPYLITLMPEDYFSRDRREVTYYSEHHPIVRLLILVLKNLVGYILIFLGITMLVLPGQGILTIIIGLFFVDFPRKYQFERWLASRVRVLKTLNWVRKRAGKKPLSVTNQFNSE